MRHRSLFLPIVALALSGLAQAQGYPAKPVRMIVPFPAGGATDIVARLVAQKMTESFGQQVLVDNRGGAAGTIGSDAAAKAAPDGYTLLVGTSSTHAIAPSLYAKLPYDPVKDFTPVAGLATSTITLSAHPSVPARNVKELIALAKARPDMLSFASSGAGGVSHLVGEMFKAQAGIQMLHVPYKGDAPALADLVGGQVSLEFGTAVAFLPYIQSGKLRALAVTSLKRSPALPDVPTVSESGLKGFEALQWFGVFAPAGTPRDLVTRLNSEILRIVQTGELKERLGKLASEAMPGSPEQFAAFQKAEIAKWAKVVKTAGVKLD
ncbi:MAG: Bug family tripartite tricarboxylate transporter substrate binding protein [Rhodospirillaceae bacterium]